MVGKSFLDFCHPEDKDLVQRHFLNTVKIQGRQSVSNVYRITNPFGDPIHSVDQVLSNSIHVQSISKHYKEKSALDNSFIESVISVILDARSNSTLLESSNTNLFTARR